MTAGGKRYAVLIGNGSFTGDDGAARLPTLRCPAADVADLKALFEQPAHGGYAVTTLIDRPHNENRRALYDCLKRATSEDQVLVYYSGHGKLDELGNLYLAGSDTDPDSLDPTAFAASDLQKYVAESLASARIVILDCCFSGAVERIFRHGSTKGDIAEQVGQALRAQASQGVFYLTASTDMQTAEEKDHDRYSLLTKHIISGIAEGVADSNDDGEVRFSELCAFVQGTIRGEGAQRPLSFALNAYGDPVVALSGRPALAARRERIEQQVYALRAKKLLLGPDAARIFEYIHRPDADANTLRDLHEACTDDAAFLKTVHRLPELPDVATMAKRSLPDDATGRETSFAQTSLRSAAEINTNAPTSSTPERHAESNGATARTLPRISARAAIASAAVAVCLILAAVLIFRPPSSPDQASSANSLGFTRQSGPITLTPTHPEVATSHNEVPPNNLVKPSGPLVKDSTSPLLNNKQRD